MSELHAPVPFDKYEVMGAYHWLEADPLSGHFNPPLAARYGIVTETVGALSSPSWRALDVGCGDGFLMGRLSPLLRWVVGIDSESRGVELASARLEPFANCRVLGASSYRLPFRDSSFDLVTCTDVIEHLNSLEAALSEITRVLDPGGHLVLTTPQWRPERVWDHRHVKEYQPAELSACLETFFRNIDLEYFWPMRWSRWYATRIGWRLIPHFCRHFSNPFSRRGRDPEAFGQILAVCRGVRDGGRASQRSRI